MSLVNRVDSSEDVAVDQLTQGFAGVVHTPVVRLARKVDEAAEALEAAAAALSAEQSSSAATDEQLAQLTAAMARMAAYTAKAQKLVRDMRAVRDKAAQLRARVDKLEQKQLAADAQLADFAKLDAAREASLEAQPAAAAATPLR